MTTPDESIGTELLERVQGVLARYCVLPSQHAYVAVTLFAAYTHAANAFDFAPRLVLTSPEKRSGKTRCMEVVALMSHRPMKTANASTAAIYRSLDTPITLLLDEADTVFGTKIKAEQNEDLRGILNAGFQRGTPVIRYDAGRRAVEHLPTFSPVVLAAIGRLPDTITDRAVNIRLRRRKPSENVEPFRLSRDADPLKALGYDVGTWISENIDTLKLAQPDLPVEDRAADLWEPLVAIADLAGGPWPRRARAAAVALTKDAAVVDADHSVGHELLTDIQALLDRLPSEWITTESLRTSLMAVPDSRWHDEGLSGRKLAILLRRYGIAVGRNPSTQMRERGYRRSDFTDAFDRYLQPPQE
ncbi:DUF3631 domain-containing protein [Xylanimonas ulmi]|uniref:Uncharacterized protein DUF3631 n=1 Tax=Xylanimonas ulmi TaxID=228973 RepID=A0A4Q7M5E7_9MICO|nr:DUF3631 domain-containing protein [Xylanibacterium ulmi]RZS62197.1 uncharacterized protein DUF3631 [Xylanibacterium ulmi]